MNKQIDDPKVSVIIPVYNTEKYLCECLDSVTNQTLRELEIICVDDGSTDGSLSILQKYRAKDARIKVIRQENTGPSAARNIGMRQANGKYISFVDSDDYIELNALETAYRRAEEQELEIIEFSNTRFSESEELLQTVYDTAIPKAGSTDVITGVRLMRESKRAGTYQAPVTIRLWKSAFLQENGLCFKEGIVQEDELFTVQALLAANRVRQFPDRLYHRRVRSESIMTKPKSNENVIGYFNCAVELLKTSLINEPGAEQEQEIRGAYVSLIEAAMRIYSHLPSEEKEKVRFSGETTNELFRQTVVDALNLQRQQAELDKAKDQLTRHQYDLDCVHRSLSFRIGRILTWLPRNIRNDMKQRRRA